MPCKSDNVRFFPFQIRLYLTASGKLIFKWKARLNFFHFGIKAGYVLKLVSSQKLFSIAIPHRLLINSILLELSEGPNLFRTVHPFGELGP
eukprot:Gb_15828 [translate_table: standard]